MLQLKHHIEVYIIRLQYTWKFLHLGRCQMTVNAEHSLSTTAVCAVCYYVLQAVKHK
jgi:hypothetical protein